MALEGHSWMPRKAADENTKNDSRENLSMQMNISSVFCNRLK